MTALAQPHMALALANEVRLARAQRRRDLAALPSKEGISLVIEWIGATPPELDRMNVRDLLRGIHQWGGRRADKALIKVGISSTSTVGALTERQRLALTEHLEERIERWGLSWHHSYRWTDEAA